MVHARHGGSGRSRGIGGTSSQRYGCGDGNGREGQELLCVHQKILHKRSRRHGPHDRYQRSSARGINPSRAERSDCQRQQTKENCTGHGPARGVYVLLIDKSPGEGLPGWYDHIDPAWLDTARCAGERNDARSGNGAARLAVLGDGMQELPMACPVEQFPWHMHCAGAAVPAPVSAEVAWPVCPAAACPAAVAWFTTAVLAAVPTVAA